MELSDEEIINRLKLKSRKLSTNYLINKLLLTKNITISLLQPLLNGYLNGNETNDLYGDINPLHWEFGHVICFWIEKTLKFLDINNITLKNSYLYDSFKTNKKTRFDKLNTIDNINDLFCKYKLVINKLLEFLLKNRNIDGMVNAEISYLIFLSLLHNEMHNESFCYSLQLLDQHKPQVINLFFKQYNLTINFCTNKSYKNHFIKIKSGNFIQGWNDMNENFTFDNESPAHIKHVKSFEITKYPVTINEYIKFINDNGYKKQKYWCNEGWKWINDNNINLPLYWKFENNKYLFKKWNNWIELNTDSPIYHISWYEANAYCKWAGGRLPTETEWEYLSTNKGKTKYPWGDYLPKSNNANLNYNLDGPCNVYDNNYGTNDDGVEQLIGNVWEWCMESFYPYDGFKIDPVYREMSYPFFGYKKICRGGSWCVSDFLINSKYRNAQSPECRIQYIGFRIAKDL